MNLPCENQQDLIQELLDGALSAPDMALLQTHLAACEGCQAHHDAMASTFDNLDDLLSMPMTGAPDLVAALGLDSPVPALAAAPVRPVAKKPHVGRFAWAAAAACAVLTVGVFGSQHASTSVMQTAHKPVHVASASATAGELDEDAALLTWFGPEADPADTAF